MITAVDYMRKRSGTKQSRIESSLHWLASRLSLHKSIRHCLVIATGAEIQPRGTMGTPSRYVPEPFWRAPPDSGLATRKTKVTRTRRDRRSTQQDRGRFIKQFIRMLNQAVMAAYPCQVFRPGGERIGQLYRPVQRLDRMPPIDQSECWSSTTTTGPLVPSIP